MENKDFEVVLVGPPGCGKSVMARALLFIFQKYGVSRVYSVRRLDFDREQAYLEWKAGR